MKANTLFGDVKEETTPQDDIVQKLCPDPQPKSNVLPEIAATQKIPAEELFTEHEPKLKKKRVVPDLVMEDVVMEEGQGEEVQGPVVAEGQGKGVQKRQRGPRVNGPNQKQRQRERKKVRREKAQREGVGGAKWWFYTQ